MTMAIIETDQKVLIALTMNFDWDDISKIFRF